MCSSGRIPARAGATWGHSELQWAFFYVADRSSKVKQKLIGKIGHVLAGVPQASPKHPTGVPQVSRRCPRGVPEVAAGVPQVFRTISADPPGVL